MIDWIDTDGDGVGNIGTSDTNGDGVIDHVMLDSDGNHVIDVYVLDIDNNGVADIAYSDENEDGYVDGYAADENQDGTADSFGVDHDQDGVFVAPGIPVYTGPVQYVDPPVPTNESVANQIVIDQINADAMRDIANAGQRINENIWDVDLNGSGGVGDSPGSRF